MNAPPTTRSLLLLMVAMLPAALRGQQPILFDTTTAAVGASKIRTQYLIAQGHWSNAGEGAAPDSTEIVCYRALGFCDVADASLARRKAAVDLETYDILRWDDRELIAVDSSQVCVMNTIRADLKARRVTLSATSKGVTDDPMCKGATGSPTAFLLGVDPDGRKAASLRRPAP